MKKNITIKAGAQVYRIDIPDSEPFETRKDFNTVVHIEKNNQVYYYHNSRLYRVFKSFVSFLSLVICASLLLTAEAKACSRSLDELSPEMKNKTIRLQKIAADKNIDFIVICTYRTPEEQSELYEIGRSIPGKKITWTLTSKHTERKAIDVAIKKNGEITWDPKEYKALGELAKHLGLTWGGNWKAKDYGHFQLGE